MITIAVAVIATVVIATSRSEHPTAGAVRPEASSEDSEVESPESSRPVGYRLGELLALERDSAELAKGLELLLLPDEERESRFTRIFGQEHGRMLASSYQALRRHHLLVLRSAIARPGEVRSHDCPAAHSSLLKKGSDPLQPLACHASSTIDERV